MYRVTTESRLMANLRDMRRKAPPPDSSPIPAELVQEPSLFAIADPKCCRTLNARAGLSGPRGEPRTTGEQFPPQLARLTRPPARLPPARILLPRTGHARGSAPPSPQALDWLISVEEPGHELRFLSGHMAIPSRVASEGLGGAAARQRARRHPTLSAA